MDKSEKEETKRTRKKILVISIIVLILIHIILNLIKVSFTKTEIVETTEEYESELDRVSLDSTSVEHCYKVDYRWNYTWDGYSENENQKIVPRFRLYNYEQLPGNFYIEFGFFDEAIHHYGQYQGIDYEKVKDELPWKDASMHSENISVNMDSGQSKLITASVSRKDHLATYWTYALVTVPKRTVCERISVNGSKAPPKTETRYRTVEKEQESTTRITLWEFLVIKFKNSFS